MSDEYPLVCICIPTYNAADTVYETINSILSQTYSNLVVHVSDNASTDDTIKVIERIGDSRVTIHQFAKNIGGEGNFNRCIQLAEGKYTAIFHADDVYEPDMVAKQIAFLEANPSAGAVFTEATIIDESGSGIGKFCLPKDIESSNGLYDFTTMFKAVIRHSNIFICPSVMVLTRVYQQEIKCWRGDLFKSSSDLDVWLRILQRHPVGYLHKRLMRYRISSKQFSAGVRLGTERADFFLVTDYYLAQQQISCQLTPVDLRNYTWLERRDRVVRAINLYILGQVQQVPLLLNDLYCRDAANAALTTKRGLFVLLVGTYLEILMYLGLNKLGKASLSFIKKWSHR